MDISDKTVPDGWQLVPKHANYDMYAAFYWDADDWYARYENVLKAAPSPPQMQARSRPLEEDVVSVCRKVFGHKWSFAEVEFVKDILAAYAEAAMEDGQ